MHKIKLVEKIGYKDYKRLLDELLEQLKNSFGSDNILSVAIFGSVARGEARPDSDIDILIVHKELESNPTTKFVSEILFPIKEGVEYTRLSDKGLKPDPYPIFMTETELWERPLILLDILEHGIILYDIGVLKRRLEALARRLQELGAKKVILENGKWYWDLKPDWKPGEVIEL